MAGDCPARAESPGQLQLAAPDAQIPYTAGDRRAAAHDPARFVGAGRAGADHRHRPRFPRPRQFARRERDPILPADRERAADLAQRAPPAGRAAALGGGAVARWSTRPPRRPRPDTLLWYRLACTLPQRLPDDVLRDSGAEERQAIQADYRLIIEGLGPCARTRAPALEGRELDSNAGAIRIDVGLTGGDSKRGDAASRGDQIVDLSHERFLQVEAAPLRERGDLGAQEIIVPGARPLVRVRRSCARPPRPRPSPSSRCGEPTSKS